MAVSAKVSASTAAVNLNKIASLLGMGGRRVNHRYLLVVETSFYYHSSGVALPAASQITNS